MIYLMSPYTASAAHERASRSRKCGEAIINLANSGIKCFSPVFYGHSLEDKFRLNLPYEHWIDFGLQMLTKCDRAWVYTLPGWRESNGMRVEVEMAIKLEIPLSTYQLFDAEHVTLKEVFQEYGLTPRVPQKFTIPPLKHEEDDL